MTERIKGTYKRDYFVQAGKGPGRNEIEPNSTCFSTSLIMALSTQNYDLDVIPKTHNQPEDRLSSIALNKSRWKLYSDIINKKRLLDNPKFKPFDWTPTFNKGMTPNQFYEVMCYIINEIYGEGTAIQTKGVLFQDIINDIDRGQTPVILGSFYMQPEDEILFNHFVAVVGYKSDRDKSEIIINDPYPANYRSVNGYNQRFDYVSSSKAQLFNNGDLLNDNEKVFIGPYKVLIKALK